MPVEALVKPGPVMSVQTPPYYDVPQFGVIQEVVVDLQCVNTGNAKDDLDSLAQERLYYGLSPSHLHGLDLQSC